ncbi:MAG: hypothetical protein HY535_02605 [Chloroflexi bacterium]|nr:hypothetical protein [Chloroflexota bacterium]
MFGKNAVFYLVASTITGVVAQALGADIGVVLFASLLVPPVILLAIALIRYWGWI